MAAIKYETTVAIFCSFDRQVGCGFNSRCYGLAASLGYALIHICVLYIQKMFSGDNLTLFGNKNCFIESTFTRV